jgi:hypothetical protein
LELSSANWELTEAEKRRAGRIVMRAAVAIVSSETKDSSAGRPVFLVLFAAAAVAAVVVAVAVFRPIAHD